MYESRNNFSKQKVQQSGAQRNNYLKMSMKYVRFK